MKFHKKACECQFCASLSPEELMAFQEKQREARAKGGRVRAAQPSFAKARKQGGITAYNNAIQSGDVRRMRAIEHFMSERNQAVAAKKGCTPADIKREYLGETHAGLITGKYRRNNE